MTFAEGQTPYESNATHQVHDRNARDVGRSRRDVRSETPTTRFYPGPVFSSNGRRQAAALSSPSSDAQSLPALALHVRRDVALGSPASQTSLEPFFDLISAAAITQDAALDQLEPEALVSQGLPLELVVPPFRLPHLATTARSGSARTYAGWGGARDCLARALRLTSSSSPAESAGLTVSTYSNVRHTHM